MSWAVPGAAAATVAVALLAGGTAALSAPALPDAAPALGGVAVTTLAGYGERGTHVVAYRHGQVLELSVPVRNRGRLPLRVEGAAFDQVPLSLLEVRDVRAVTVPAGETRSVRVEAVLGNCRYFHEREMQTYDALELDVSVLGRSAVRTVRLDRPLLVHSPMIVGCPDRKIDRQAHDRRGARSG